MSTADVTIKNIEVLSIVNFSNSARVSYLENSFGSFHKFNPGVRHIVIDGSAKMGAQEDIYKKFGIEYYHHPGLPYCERLKIGAQKLKLDYFVFLPDDFNWIFSFPLTNAIEQCRKYDVSELKLTCRGMNWFSQYEPAPKSWFEITNKGAQVASGEHLQRHEDLYVSNQRIRDFHEQFSLACNLIKTQFLRNTIRWIPKTAPSPGKVERYAYLALALTKYKTAYYKMWIPAFHFIDLNVEGTQHQLKADTMLYPRNFELYNRTFNI